MKYLMNRVKISLKIIKIKKVENGYKITSQIPTTGTNKREVIVIGFIHSKKLRDIALVEDLVYDFEGYLSNSEYTYKSKLHKVQLNVDSFELNSSGKYINNVEVVGQFVSKTESVKLPRNKKVCNLKVDFLSKNLADSDIEIAVWNTAVDALEHAKQGQKLHLSSFVMDNFHTDFTTSFKLSPFKVTLL